MTAEKKFALIIANSRYEDALLRQLVAPPQDAEGLSQVLADPSICGFEVRTLVDEPSYRACEEIEGFFEERERDDLTMLYFSGHGITDDDGLLYYAACNTKRNRLRATAIAATWVNEMMTRCRSRRQVLLLDCCHSGAFARTKSAATVNVGQQLAASAREEGRGRFVITASDAFQYSFEGDSVEGQGVYSVFTKALVEGLRTGEADLDSDGLITLDELYRFVHRRVREQTPQQSPRKWESDAEGTVVIGLNPRPAEAALPDDLIHTIENLIPEARERAIPRLNSLLRGKHRGLALAAENALIKLADDDSRRVSSAAQKCLADFGARAEEVAALSRTPVEPVPAAKPATPPKIETPVEAKEPIAVVKVPEMTRQAPLAPRAVPSSAARPAAEAAGPVSPEAPKAVLSPQDVAVPLPATKTPLAAARPEQPKPSPPTLVEESQNRPIPASDGDSIANPVMVAVAPVAMSPAVRVQGEGTGIEPGTERGARVRDKILSFPRPFQILVFAVAGGLVWAIAGAVRAVLSNLAGSGDFRNLATLLMIPAGGVYGWICARAFHLFAPQLPRRERAKVVWFWLFCALASAVLSLNFIYLPILRAFVDWFGSLRAAATPMAALFVVLDVVAGALSGAVFARTMGRTRKVGLVIGGLCFLVADVIGRWIFKLFSSGAFYFSHSRARWYPPAVIGLHIFVEASLGLGGLLWLLRQKGQPALAMDGPVASMAAANASPPDSSQPTVPAKAETDLAGESWRARIGRSWRRLPVPLQILIVSTAMGIAWAILWLANVKWSGDSNDTGMFLAAFISAGLLGLVLGQALKLFPTAFTWKQRATIASFWVIGGILGAMLRTESWNAFWIPFLVRLHFGVSVQRFWTAWIYTLMAPNVIAGALTGWFFAPQVGARRRKGLVIGGLSFLIAGIVGPWSGMVLFGLGTPMDYWWAGLIDSTQDASIAGVGAIYRSLSELAQSVFDQNWVALTGLAFVEGTVGVGGLLWFLRNKDRPSS